MLDWFTKYEGLLIGLGVSSVVIFIGSVFVIPLLISLLPKDYFIRVSKPLRELSPLHLVGRLVKNVMGLILLAAGFVMLFIPGQGILTAILGLSLIDFPEKRRWEIRLLNAPRIRKMVQWCREKAGREPLEIPKN